MAVLLEFPFVFGGDGSGDSETSSGSFAPVPVIAASAASKSTRKPEPVGVNKADSAEGRHEQWRRGRDRRHLRLRDMRRDRLVELEDRQLHRLACFGTQQPNQGLHRGGRVLEVSHRGRVTPDRVAQSCASGESGFSCRRMRIDSSSFFVGRGM